FNANNNYLNDAINQNPDDGIFNGFFNIGKPNQYNQTLKTTYQIPVDKLPYLGFITSEYGYTANFDWQAASETYVEKIGNVIQNSNTHNFNTSFNFAKLYEDSGFKNLFIKK